MGIFFSFNPSNWITIYRIWAKNMSPKRLLWGSSVLKTSLYLYLYAIIQTDPIQLGLAKMEVCVKETKYKIIFTMLNINITKYKYTKVLKHVCSSSFTKTMQ